eukprot:CFRG8078T1
MSDRILVDSDDQSDDDDDLLLGLDEPVRMRDMNRPTRPLSNRRSNDDSIDDSNTASMWSFNQFNRHRDRSASIRSTSPITLSSNARITFQEEDDRRYEDYTTIDWLRDTSAERARQRTLHDNAQTSVFGWANKMLGDSWQGWLVAFLVGICTGTFAAAIDVGTDWLSGLKLGVCKSGIWLNHTLCCWTSREENCPNWQQWTQLVDGNNSDTPLSTSSWMFGYFAYVSTAVLFAVYSAMLVRSFAPYARGSGIPEVKTILSGFIIRRYLGLSTLFIKSVGLTLAVGSGLSLGKEGPLVHVACCVGNVFSRLFYKYRTNEAKKREIMSAAAAAGVGVAFGAPIGGVLFSLEEVSYYFPHKTMWRSFFCALTAAGTLKYLDPFRTGRLVMFSVNIHHTWHAFEVPLFILLGVVGGAVGALFVKLNVLWCKAKGKTRIGKNPILEVCAVALVTVLVRYPSTVLRMSTSELIHMLFAECDESTSDSLICTLEAGDHVLRVVMTLLLASIFTLFITVFTFGMPVPAGIFIPSMAIGATLGRVLGILVNHVVINHAPTSSFFEDVCHGERSQCVIPGIYAVVGAAAVLGGVTRMTVSLVVIIFELTGSVDFIIPVMLSCLCSKWTADLLGGIDGIYDQHIRLSRYPFLDCKEEYHHDYTASQCMQSHSGAEGLCVITSRDNTIHSLEDLLEKTTFTGFPLIHSVERRGLVGYVTRRELRRALDSAKKKGIDKGMRVFFNSNAGIPATHAFVDLRSCLDPGPIQVSGSTPMEIVIDMFRKIGIRYTLVTIDGDLAGIITKKDVLKHVASLESTDSTPNNSFSLNCLHY